MALVEQSNCAFWNGSYTRPLDYMRHRGFTDDTLASAQIGYHAGAGPDGDTCYVPRETWGLPTYTYIDRNGKERTKHAIWLPRGIVIPWFIEGQLWRVFIRRPTADPKYYIVPGGSNALYNADALVPGKPAVLVEAALDALAIQQEAGDLVAAVATGTTGARAIKWLTRLASCTPHLLSFDRDAGGDSPTAYWRSVFPDAQVWRAFGDDPATMLKHGHNLRTWVAAGLRHVGYAVPDPDALKQARLSAAAAIVTGEGWQEALADLAALSQAEHADLCSKPKYAPRLAELGYQQQEVQS
jgi:hypothetical protein